MAAVVGLLARTATVNLMSSPAIENRLDWYVTLAGCAVPIGFLVGLLRMRLRRAVVADLLVELKAATTVADVRAALSRTLGDPSQEMATTPPTDVPPPGRGRALLGSGPGPTLVLTYDTVLDEDLALLAAALAAALAVEHLAGKAERANRAAGAGTGLSRLSRLTPREREVFTLIAQGLTDRAIAQRRSSPRRPRRPTPRAIFRKLDLPEGPRDNRPVQAVLAYLRSGTVANPNVGVLPNAGIGVFTDACGRVRSYRRQ